MKPSRTSIRSGFASIVILASCPLACAATGRNTPQATGTPFDGACVAATVSGLRVSAGGAVNGRLSVRNQCSVAVMLLLSPVHADLVRSGELIPWMGPESGRNAFVRMVLIEDGINVDKVFAGDAALNAYAPLKAVQVEPGSGSSIPIEGRLLLVVPGLSVLKGQLLLPCFPSERSVTHAAVLDVGDVLGSPNQGDGEPRRLPSGAVLVHTPLFPILMAPTK